MPLLAGLSTLLLRPIGRRRVAADVSEDAGSAVLAGLPLPLTGAAIDLGAESGGSGGDLGGSLQLIAAPGGDGG
jgi:hypothetical protein